MAWPKVPKMKRPYLDISLRRSQEIFASLWNFRVRSVLWVVQCVALFLVFCGVCGAGADGMGWIWWSLLLQIGVTVVNMVAHWRPGLLPAGGLAPVVLMSGISCTTSMLAGDRAIQAAYRTAGGLKACYCVIACGWVLALVTFIPLIMHVAASSQLASAGSHTLTSRISLPNAKAGLQHLENGTSELHFVDLSSAEEGRGTGHSQMMNNRTYKAYSNPYAGADDSVPDVGTILPSLMPQAGYPHPPPDLPPSPPPTARVCLANVDTNSTASPSMRDGIQPQGSSEQGARKRASQDDLPAAGSTAREGQAAFSLSRVPMPGSKEQSPRLSQAPRAAEPMGAKENDIASVTHESPLQTVPLLVEIDKESVEFASPRGAASTVDGDETPKYPGPQSNFPVVGGHGHAPGFLNQGESESDSDEEFKH